ncbi:MAG TPA: mechanosensitive ion channel domain-containing protein [Candidatus Acidoferrum sp.]|nr:mechanosensitive ion channel domain-containing protein [Candidatus Acidoferrum sp.]
MGKSQKTIFAVLALLLIAALSAVILTWSWGDYRARLRAMRTASKQQQALVDTRAVDTAEQLAQLAESRREKSYAQEAQRLADYSVDAAFAAALLDAEQYPAPLTPQTRQISERIKTGEAVVAADQSRIAQLNQQVAKASARTKDNLQQQLALSQAQLELDQDELDDAHQDLIRAGGDKQASIQRLLDQRQASQKTAAAQSSAANAANAAPSIELTKSSSLIAQAEAWLSLNSKQTLLRQAQQNAFDRQAKLAIAHDELEKNINEEKTQKKIIRKKSVSTAKSAAKAEPNGAKPAPEAGGAAPKPDAGAEATGNGGQGNNAPATASATGVAGSASESAGQSTALSFLKDLTIDQKNLSQLDKRIENEQELAALYGNWIDYVTVRKRAFVHGILVAAFWIFLIALCVAGANEGAQRFFSDLSPERRELQTLRTVILFGVQALGIVLILLVIFGKPSNFATVVALAGAGLTVALKDFIVGFFGWFVLMGKDGIRPGDWVEINGVGGEVLEVGLFHTVLLETGNWTDAAHPTGRKVTFVNSFAIEGHYINFSTSGQWLWDELQVQVPANADPYPIAEEIQRIVAEVTKPSQAFPEHGAPGISFPSAKGSVSTAPSVSVRLEGSGISILVRYLTRAPERQEVRARLYRALIELLRQESPKRTTV